MTRRRNSQEGPTPGGTIHHSPFTFFLVDSLARLYAVNDPQGETVGRTQHGGRAQHNPPRNNAKVASSRRRIHPQQLKRGSTFDRHTFRVSFFFTGNTGNKPEKHTQAFDLIGLFCSQRHREQSQIDREHREQLVPRRCEVVRAYGLCPSVWYLVLPNFARFSAKETPAPPPIGGATTTHCRKNERNSVAMFIHTDFEPNAKYHPIDWQPSMPHKMPYVVASL